MCPALRIATLRCALPDYFFWMSRRSCCKIFSDGRKPLRKFLSKLLLKTLRYNLSCTIVNLMMPCRAAQELSIQLHYHHCSANMLFVKCFNKINVAFLFIAFLRTYLCVPVPFSDWFVLALCWTLSDIQLFLCNKAKQTTSKADQASGNKITNKS